MTLSRIPRAAPGELATVSPIEAYRPLDKYAGGLAEDLPQVPWLATMSAGYKGPDGYPKASRRTDDAWIHMTAEDLERAPGLAEALEVGAWRSVDVALPFDDPQRFLQQHFERRSASRLEVFGDERQLTQITVRRHNQGNKTTEVGERQVWPAGSPEYADLVRTCNVSCSFFFVLARWDGRQPRIYFPATDGLGVYRLRFTSRHSLRELLASLRQISGLAGGRVSGIPLRLGVDWRQVADPTGATREIPVWTLRFMPPQGLELTPALWLDLKREAIAEGELLRALPAPLPETIEDAAAIDDPDLDYVPSPAALQDLHRGPPCDAQFYEAAWFARVRDTPLDDGAARAAFLEAYPGSNTNSLAVFLEEATEAEASALIAAVGTYLASIEHARDRELIAKHARRYDEIFGDDDSPRQQPSPPTQAAASPPDPRPSPEPAAVEPPTPPPADPLTRNRQLVAQAKQLGLAGLPPLADTSEGVEGINKDLEQRIENARLDQAEDARQKREEGVK